MNGKCADDTEVKEVREVLVLADIYCTALLSSSYLVKKEDSYESPPPLYARVYSTLLLHGWALTIINHPTT